MLSRHRLAMMCLALSPMPPYRACRSPCSCYNRFSCRHIRIATPLSGTSIEVESRTRGEIGGSLAMSLNAQWRQRNAATARDNGPGLLAEVPKHARQYNLTERNNSMHARRAGFRPRLTTESAKAHKHVQGRTVQRYAAHY